MSEQPQDQPVPDNEPDTTADPIPVADQKAAGVPPEETVTIAEQKQGAEVHPAALGEAAGQFEAASTTAPENMAAPIQGAANQSPLLPPNAQAGAAKAHAYLGHLIAVAEAARAEIEKYVPAELVSAAQVEAGAFIRSIL